MTDNGSYFEKRRSYYSDAAKARSRARAFMFAHPLRCAIPVLVCAVFCGSFASSCAVCAALGKNVFPIAAAAYFICFPVINAAALCCAARANGEKFPLWKLFEPFCGAKRLANSISASLLSLCALAAYLSPALISAYLPARLGASAQTRIFFELCALFAACAGWPRAFALAARGGKNGADARFYAPFAWHFALILLTKGLWSIILIPYAGISYGFYKERQK